MKRLLTVFLACLTFGSALAFTSCGDGSSQSENPTTAPTESTTAETKPAEKKTSNELKKYEKSFVEGDSPVYGVWKLSNLDYMYIIFRNDKLAELAMGSEGYFSKYKLDEKAGTLTVQLLPGSIDGEYNYEFSEDYAELYLTLDGETLTLIKEKKYTMIPSAPENPVIDENLLGWWENADGMTYYFGEDGLMYNNAIARETYYTYSAENKKITAVYNYGGDMDETLSYQLKDEKLIVDGDEYTRK